MARTFPILWIDEKNLWFPGVEISAGTSPTVFLEHGEKRKIKQDRIAFRSRVTVEATREELENYRIQFEDKSKALESEIQELWHLLVSGNQKKLYLTEELASFVGDPDSDAIWFDAFRYALKKDCIYFRPKGDGFALVEAHAVEQRERQKRALQRETKKRKEMADAVRSRFEATDSEPLGDTKSSKVLGKAFELLEKITLAPENNAPDKEALRLLEEILGGPPGNRFTEAFDILVRAGLYEPDELLELRLQQTSTHFSSETQGWTEDFLKAEPQPSESAPSALHIITIDDASSRDLDDAVALEKREDGHILHIMITDVAKSIPIDSPAAQEALDRATTIYLPNKTIPMLPVEISEDRLSLNAGQSRNVLDFQIKLDQNNTPSGLKIVPREIKVSERISYTQADRILRESEQEPTHDELESLLNQLRIIALQLRRQRNERGAFLWSMDEFKFQVDQSGLKVERIDPLSPSRILVQELMILVGAMTASFCMEAEIPTIFRCQKAGQSPMTLTRPATSEIFARIVTMSAATLSTTPAAHEGLGIPAYVQITSPLRRFQDFLSQLQLRSYLTTGSVAMTQDKLMEVFANLETKNRANRKIMKSAQAYWALKYYAERGEFNTEALVLQTWARKARLVFLDTGFQTDWKSEREIPAGTTVQVSISYANPRTGTLRMRVR